MKDVQIDFALNDDGMHRREAFRVGARGLGIRFTQDDIYYPLTNISSTGLGFQGNKASYTKFDTYIVQLECQGKIILANIHLRVVRVAPDGVLGCCFVELTQKQTVVIDKLILVLQKRLISSKKTSC